MTDETNSGSTPQSDSGSGDMFNTAAGWVLFAGVVGLGLSILSDKFFHGYSPERPEKLGYIIEGVEEEGGGDTGPGLGTLLSSATAEDGEKVFAKCQACHTVEQGGANGVGPNLYGVMGKALASNASDFRYSPRLSEKGGEWTWEAMDAWLASPRAFTSGTTMSFAGLSKAEDRAAVMLFLEANGGAPAKPAVEAEGGEEEAVAEGEEVAAEEAEAEADVTAVAEDAQNASEEVAEEAVEGEE
ncbi:MAG: c-type cytochrome [Erythrobacter sp.]